MPTLFIWVLLATALTPLTSALLGGLLDLLIWSLDVLGRGFEWLGIPSPSGHGWTAARH